MDKQVGRHTTGGWTHKQVGGLTYRWADNKQVTNMGGPTNRQTGGWPNKEKHGHTLLP